MRRLLPLLALVGAIVAASGPARAEALAAALSTPMVSITSNFAGTDVTVFGSIAPDKGKAAPAKGYDIVIVLEGPKRGMLARRKERVFGIWINKSGRFYPDVPTFHAVASTLPVDMITKPEEALRQHLALGDLRFGGRSEGDDVEAADFHDAVIRLQERRGVYGEYPTSVSFLGEQLFSTTIPIPAEVPVGHYETRVYAYADKKPVASKVVDLLVVKSGFEQQVADLATKQPVIYGLLSVFIALFTGWLGGVLFRRD